MMSYNQSCKKIVVIISVFVGSQLIYGSDSADSKSVRSELMVEKVVDLKPEVSPRIVSSPIVSEVFAELEVGGSVVERVSAAAIGAVCTSSKPRAIENSSGRSGGCVPVDSSSPVDRSVGASPCWKAWRW